MKFFKAILSIMLVLILIGIISETAFATPPVIPTPRPSVSSGSGSSSSSSSSGPTFTPFVDTLLSSDGSTIGSLTGKTAFVVDLLASNNSSVDGKNISLTMEAELTQRPPTDARLDILIKTPDHSGLPKGMNDVSILSMVNISKHASYGWVVKPETVKLTFSVTGVTGADDGAVYYLVRYDGSSYHIQDATLTSSDAGVMTFVVSPGADSGLFTLVVTGSALPTPTPTPMATTAASQTNTTHSTDTASTSSGTSTIFGMDLPVFLAIFGGTLFTVAAVGWLLYMLYFRK